MARPVNAMLAISAMGAASVLIVERVRTRRTLAMLRVSHVRTPTRYQMVMPLHARHVGLTRHPTRMARPVNAMLAISAMGAASVLIVERVRTRRTLAMLRVSHVRTPTRYHLVMPLHARHVGLTR